MISKFANKNDAQENARTWLERIRRPSLSLILKSAKVKIMELERWTKADPLEERCDFILKSTGSRCCNKAIGNTKRCPLHGANTRLASEEKKNLRQYNLAKFQGRVDGFLKNSKLQNLNEELALLKMLLEANVLKCEDMDDLILASGPITHMVEKVQKLAETVDRMEMKSGELLGKQQIQNLASTLMQAVATKLREFVEAFNERPEAEISEHDVSSLLEAVANEFLSALQGDS